MVNLLFTVEAGVAERALAVVATLWVGDAHAVIETRAVGAVHGTQLAVPAIVPRRAGARVGILHILLTQRVH